MSSSRDEASVHQAGVKRHESREGMKGMAARPAKSLKRRKGLDRVSVVVKPISHNVMCVVPRFEMLRSSPGWTGFDDLQNKFLLSARCFLNRPGCDARCRGGEETTDPSFASPEVLRVAGLG